MADLLFLSQEQVRPLLDLDTLRDSLSRAFRALTAGDASVPPRTAAFAERGLLGAMPGYLQGVALGAKLVSVFAGNHAAGLPSHQALICLFDAGTGMPLAIMDGGYITAVRTAGASAVAVDLLARADSKVLTILGSGVQGAAHLDAMARVRSFDDIRLSSRNPDHAAGLAARHACVRVVPTFEEAVRGADVVCCCTDSSEPVISGAWLSPGAHVSSVGIGREVDRETVASARCFAEWRGAVTNPPPAGAAEFQGLDPDSIAEVGEVLLSKRLGRTSSEQITLYKSTGHAVEDIAAASLVYDRAVELGVGTRLSL